ncbi:unnamed protein product [Litomosoides sigmodontis]|uniref:RING-type domain-containing protein n=1 Tax=Litomosoides sigmodontis TaxID=42156 RepID=A0A3P6V8W9_LITSI|nr:unnamed protein product [Litomosoides sigmodontis]
MALSWVHCNNCYLIAVAQSTARRVAFAVASCGHIFCSTCLDKCVTEKMCTVCRRSPFTYENIGRSMSEKTKKYFQTPNDLVMNTLRQVNSVIKFQQNQYNTMRNNVTTFRGQMTDVADRYSNTAKIFNFLLRNSNTLLTNIRRHHGIMQRLSNSFVNCAQSMKYFEDLNENVDTSRSTDLEHCSYEGNKQSLPSCNTTINEPFMHRSDISKNPSMSLTQSVKIPENLAVIFGGKERRNKPIKCNNPYMQYLLQNNARSSSVTDENLSCSTLTSIKKDGFNLLQVGSKGRPKVPGNMQLSQSKFERESNTHGPFTAVRTHSLSRSPPRKSRRPLAN